jgi:hypothetical protein
LEVSGQLHGQAAFPPGKTRIDHPGTGLDDVEKRKFLFLPVLEL